MQLFINKLLLFVVEYSLAFSFKRKKKKKTFVSILHDKKQQVSMSLIHLLSLYISLHLTPFSFSLFTRIHFTCTNNRHSCEGCLFINLVFLTLLILFLTHIALFIHSLSQIGVSHS